ncbi:MAG: hypothetical protein K9L64_05365 [Candidatus Izimaplasma sp.]|nr:hypothetical protein [Candidatus Izimaplasma bacterium]
MNIEHNYGLKVLFKLAYISGILMLIAVPLQVIVYVAFPPPETVQGFFDLFEKSTLLGLLSLDFLYIISNLLLIPIYLGISAILLKKQPSITILALVFGVISLSCYYPSNPAFDMLTLSKAYSVAAANESIVYLAAGETLLAQYVGTAYVAYYIIGAFSLLLFAYGLYQNTEIHKRIGIWGLISGVFMLIPSSFGTIGMIFSLLSLIPWCIFVFFLLKEFKIMYLNQESGLSK